MPTITGRKIKETKEQLLKENAILKEKVAMMESRHINLRTQFSKVLNCPSARELYSRNIETMSWEQIFFTIGELNADANYTILLHEKQRLHSENEFLRNKNKFVKEGDKGNG